MIVRARGQTGTPQIRSNPAGIPGGGCSRSRSVGFVSTFRFRNPCEVVCGHGPHQLNSIRPSHARARSSMTRSTSLSWIDSHEERYIHRVELMQRLPHDAGHANPLHDALQGPRVLLPLSPDRLVDSLGELRRGRVGTLALDLVLQPRCLLVLRQDLA